MNIKYFDNLKAREKLILSAGALIASLVLIVILFLEPALKKYSAVHADISSAKNEITQIKMTDKQIGVKQLDPGRAIIYMYNYLEGVTVNSGVKIKNFQASGSQGTKGMANFQLKLGSNASTFVKLLYIAENTVPAMSVSTFRISSQSGGTYEGMRQLETIASVAISSKRLGGKTLYADGKKFKALGRDPFAPYEPKVAVKEVAKPAEVKEVAPPENWILTAAMGDGESDTLLFKKESGTVKYAVTLKKGGDVSLTWSKESVEIKSGAEKISWAMGESKVDNIIPKTLKDAIMNGDTGGAVEKAPALDGAEVVTPDPPDNKVGLSEEELKKMGITGSGGPRGRTGRRIFGGNTGR